MGKLILIDASATSFDTKRAKCYGDCDLFVRVEGYQKNDVAKKALELLNKRG